MNEQMVNLKKLLAIILQKIHDLMNGKINSIGYNAEHQAITQTIGNTSYDIIATTALAADPAFEVSWDDIQNKPTIPSQINVDNELKSNSTNPVQNKVIKTALDAKLSNAVTKIQTGAGLTASTVTSTGTIGHPTVENLAGSYGSTNNTSLTLGWDDSFNNPGIVLNNSGHTTAAFNKTLTLPGSQFAAATTSNGIKGLVPAPSTATADPAGMFQTNVSQYFLNANGGWTTIPNFTSATSNIAGYPGLVPATSTATTTKFDGTTGLSNYWLNANGMWSNIPYAGFSSSTQQWYGGLMDTRAYKNSYMTGYRGYYHYDNNEGFSLTGGYTFHNPSFTNETNSWILWRVTFLITYKATTTNANNTIALTIASKQNNTTVESYTQYFTVYNGDNRIEKASTVALLEAGSQKTLTIEGNVYTNKATSIYKTRFIVQPIAWGV